MTFDSESIMFGAFIGIMIAFTSWGLYTLWAMERDNARAVLKYEIKHEVKRELMEIIRGEIEEKK